jgi:hypothetical protein
MSAPAYMASPKIHPRSLGRLDERAYARGMTSEREGHEPSSGEPDDVVEEFEDDGAETRQARADEASDIALAAPGGIIIGRESEGPDEERFDAAHNP